MVTRHGAAGEMTSPHAAGRLARRVAMSSLRAHDERGMSLIEVMIALTIMSFGLLALASVSAAGLLSLRDARQRQAATEAASSALDAARNLPYQSIVNSTADSYINAIPTYDPDGSGCLTGESVIKLSTGPVTGAPFVAGPATPTAGQLTVRTYVTQVANLECPSTPPPIAAKRVTVVVQWLSGSAVHETRKSTMVAYSQRGQGVPNFVVTPLVMPSVGTPGTQCITHTLTNQGLTDTYEIVVTLPNDFALTVYDDANSNGIGDAGEAVPEYGGVPRTDAVATFGTKDLLFCYQVFDPNRVEIITPRVRSFYSPSISVLLTHTVTTTSELKFTLHAGDTNDADEVRVIPAPPLDSKDFPAWRMDPILPASQIIGGLFNEDDPAVDALPGALMRRLSVASPPPLTDPVDWSEPGHLRWDWQAPLGTNITGAASFKIWTAPADALGTPTLLPYVPKDVALRFRLWHLDADRNPVALMAISPDVLVAGVDTVSHLTWGWQSRIRAFVITGSHYVAKNHWIRLELACDPLDSPQDCHAAMDTNVGVLNTYYSYLQIGLV